MTLNLLNNEHANIWCFEALFLHTILKQLRTPMVYQLIFKATLFNRALSAFALLACTLFGVEYSYGQTTCSSPPNCELIGNNLSGSLSATSFTAGSNVSFTLAVSSTFVASSTISSYIRYNNGACTGGTTGTNLSLRIQIDSSTNTMDQWWGFFNTASECSSSMISDGLTGTMVYNQDTPRSEATTTIPINLGTGLAAGTYNVIGRIGSTTAHSKFVNLGSFTVAAAPTPTLLVSPTSLNFSSAGSTQSFSITSNTSWTVSDNAAWISVSPTSGSNNGTVSVTVTTNTGAARNGTVTVTAGTLTRTVSVSQDATAPLPPTCPGSVTASSNSPVSVGGTISLSASVTGSDTGITYIWTGPNGFSSSVQNPVITGATLAMSDTYTVRISKAGCPDLIDDIDVTVNSSLPLPSLPSSLSPSPVSLNFSNTGSPSQTVNVTASSTVAWMVTANESWINVSGGSGSGNGSFLSAVPLIPILHQEAAALR